MSSNDATRIIGPILRRSPLMGFSLCVILVLAAPGEAAEDHGKAAADSEEARRIEAIYSERCASCHDAATGRTPPRMALLFVPPPVIRRALSEGSMQPMAAGLSTEQIHGLSTHLSAMKDRPPQSSPAPCDAPTKSADWSPEARSGWSSTSRDGANTRFQPSPGFGAEDVPKLELAWVLGIPGGAPGSPVVSAGRLFVSTGAGEILSLDARRGCTLWSFSHDRIVRTLTLGTTHDTGSDPLVLFADDLGQAWALDARTGELRWKTRVEDHPLNRATAAPSIHDGRVFVTMSSIEDPLTHDPGHACCSSRGSVTALDASNGNILWKQYSVAKEPVPVAQTSLTTPARSSPAGGSIYTPLAVDAARGVVYASTAEAYTEEDAQGAYSVIAFDMQTGARRWERQFLPSPGDRQKVCAEIVGTDCRNVFSMGTSVTIHQARDPEGSDSGGASDLLLVGQKWGYVYALDPDRDGAPVWKRRIARGSDMGGIMYGLADDGDTIFVPVSDLYAELPHEPGDLVALDPADGSLRWRATQPEARCSWGQDESCVGAQSAAPTAIPGVVFTSAWDGFVRAHSSRTGKVIWEFDTGRRFDAINGTAQGGQISAYPIQVVDGHVYVTSGASSMARPGNALLVFAIPD